MERYLALLGAINVGGNRLSMADLRYALEREGFEDVGTVVASGNVLFSFDDRPSGGLAELLAFVIKDRFDIDSFAVVLKRDELQAAIADNPFHGDGEDAKVHTHFVSGDVSREQFDTLCANHAGRGPERLALGERAIHIDYVDGLGNSRLTTPFLEKRLGQRGTARNMRSLKRILEKMD